MVSFENFVKSMTPSLMELKVTPSFCFAFKIPDNVTATTQYTFRFLPNMYESAMIKFRISEKATKIWSYLLLRFDVTTYYNLTYLIDFVSWTKKNSSTVGMFSDLFLFSHYCHVI